VPDLISISWLGPLQKATALRDSITVRAAQRRKLPSVFSQRIITISFAQKSRYVVDRRTALSQEDLLVSEKALLNP
jgi:hypothetical protein